MWSLVNEKGDLYPYDACIPFYPNTPTQEGHICKENLSTIIAIKTPATYSAQQRFLR